MEVSRLRTASTFLPHGISADPASDRLVISSADESEARLFVAQLDRTSGRLSWDECFRDAGAGRRGVSPGRADRPHRKAAHVMGHAALFGPARQRGQ